LLGALGIPGAAGVKAARTSLRSAGLLPSASDDTTEKSDGMRPKMRGSSAALRFDRVWHEIKGGPAILRGASLTVAPGERVALMGRNGAGKSTLLRHAAGLMRPTRGKISSAGRVALLLQNPNDYLIHDTVAEEASPVALRIAGIDPQAFGHRHPRDLSGGERQRLALAVVMDPEAGDPPAVVCLDEPTRGMDRTHKSELAALLKGLDAAVLVATHDPEFVAAFAERVVLLADGAPIADGPVSEVLCGGTYFATEVARILGGAGGALTAEEGVTVIEKRRARGGGRMTAEVVA
jgi:energy-coupling factor transport system ATP-binding protein